MALNTVAPGCADARRLRAATGRYVRRLERIIAAGRRDRSPMDTCIAAA
jgi:hypothetical protein